MTGTDQKNALCDTVSRSQTIPRPGLIKAIGQVTSGNMLEMYDFMVFGYYAGDIGRAFFPSGNAQAELMLSFATFGAGFLMRSGSIDSGCLCRSSGTTSGTYPYADPDGDWYDHSCPDTRL